MDSADSTATSRLADLPPVHGRVLAVGVPGPRRERLTGTLLAAGHEVVHAAPGEVTARVAHAQPDAVVLLDDAGGTIADRLAVIREVRAAPDGQVLPLLAITPDPRPADVADMLRAGADDCLADASDPLELSARIEARLRRLPVPVERLPLDPRTGLYSGAHFTDELKRELRRPGRPRPKGVMAMIAIAELSALESRLGHRVRREVAERVAGVVRRLCDDAASERLGWDGGDGHLLMLLPGIDEEEAERRLAAFAHAVAGTRFTVAGENVRLTPAIGWTPLAACADAGQAVERARDAVTESLRHGDLRPVRYARWMHPAAARGRHRHRRGGAARRRGWWPSALASALVPLLGVGAPFLLYQQAHALLGWDLGSAMYWVVVAGLVFSSVLIVLECLFSLDAPARPDRPGQPYPPATAIIAAHLKNEAATIVDTVESFLKLDYPAELEIVLAYNTPHPLPVEEMLRDIARRDPRLVLLPVPGSTSKAQNINAAITRVRGEMVGVFDADHHPAPDSFQRAWHWLSGGYDVVQGHCLVRNGDASWVARMVAVEFEAIYAVSHPGRTRMYGFGVFGGSNGYWRTDVLARIRMHGSMLTEDIDATMRGLTAGARFTVDRTLISRELAPTMLAPLWRQRSRWAQGWLQVSLKHLWRGLRSPDLSPRQKAGLAVLLGWREVQPWLTLQILPVLLYSAWGAGGVTQLDWAVPICLLALAFTLFAGLVQGAFAWRLAAPEMRRRRRWFWRYLLTSTLFYTHFKNLVARHAHLKEALGQRQWHVTPRTGGSR
ncbi:glycosyltransferase [Streptomyces sp. 6N223]|uniref:glycosyltransferase n=1 Tax=Streptomyces sp. 6N223 TaxID=3457412 RepID=UPI003FD68D8E